MNYIVPPNIFGLLENEYMTARYEYLTNYYISSTSLFF